MDILKPEPEYQYQAFPRYIVEATDNLIEFRQKKIGQEEHFDIKSQAHWDVIIETFRIFTVFYPYAYQQFKKSIEHYKSRETKHGVAEDDGGVIQHQLELPEEFHILLKTMYPHLKYDKKFVSKLSKKLPILKATKSNI